MLDPASANPQPRSETESPPGMEAAPLGKGSVRRAFDRSWSTNAETIKLSVLMAAYNEEATVVEAVNGLLSQVYPCEFELIVVDDGSTDATAALVAQINSDRLVFTAHGDNRGKGAALRLAASVATGTHIIPFDADLEYDPCDLPRLLDPIIRGRCQVVYGTRLFGCNTVYQSYRYAVGNRLLTNIANILFDAHLSDLHTCLKLMPRSLLSEMDLREKGFGLDTELTALLLKRGVRPFEVPVSYFSRSHDQGKKIGWRDALSCFRILLKVRVSRQDPKRAAVARDIFPERHPACLEPGQQLAIDNRVNAKRNETDAGSTIQFAPTHMMAIPTAREGQVQES